MGFEQELADESASSSPPPYSPYIEDTLTTGSGYVQSD
jgi:hypothetical protein